MKNKELVSQVSIKLKIADALAFVSTNKNKPVLLDAYFVNLDKSGTTTDEFVKILSAIESAGYISNINAVMWKVIYDKAGVTFPEAIFKK